MRALTILMVAVAVAAGCANQAKQGQPQPAAAGNAGVLDVRPVVTPPPPVVSTPVAQPVYVQPVIQSAPEPVAAQPAAAVTPAPKAPAGAASSGQSYTVKKGDTLFHIARERYGDGKQWQKIASANPGVTPSSLRVGQTLVVP